MNKEKAVAFGSAHGLVGIVTPSDDSRDDTPTVVILNSGIIHRVGANRLSVLLARRFAREGLESFRFDLNGIGDSAARTEQMSLEGGIDRDINEALEYLSSTRGADHFVLMGLCSGAHNAFRAAQNDTRVSGVVLIDPVAFRTAKFYVHHLSRRIFRAGSWFNALTGKNNYIKKVVGWRRAQRLGHDSPQSAQNGPVYPRSPTRNEMAEGLAVLLHRGTQVLVVYTGGQEYLYNYGSQFGDMYPEAFAHSGLTVKFFQNADHTFSRSDHRNLLLETTTSWLNVTGGLGSSK